MEVNYGHCAGCPVWVSPLSLQYPVCEYWHHFKNEETESQEVPLFGAHTAIGGIAGILPEVCKPKPGCPSQLSYVASFSEEGVYESMESDPAQPKRWMT